MDNNTTITMVVTGDANDNINDSDRGMTKKTHVAGEENENTFKN